MREGIGHHPILVVDCVEENTQGIIEKAENDPHLLGKSILYRPLVMLKVGQRIHE